MLAFERRDTTYDVVARDGLPGSAILVRIHSDTAVVTWDVLGPQLMFLHLRGRGDSLSGWWEIGELRGDVRGRRR